MKPRKPSIASTLRPAPASGQAAHLRTAGFTLIELMMTLMVAAILMAIAIPGFRNMLLSQRLSTAANSMVNTINTARMEAIKRNASAQFCSDDPARNTNDTLGAICAANAGAVYAINNASPPVVTRILNVADLGAALQLSSVMALRFNAQGVGYQPANPATPFGGNVAQLCTSQLSTNNIYTIQMASGAILTVKPSTGSCP